MITQRTLDMAALWASDLPSILTAIHEAENGGRPIATTTEASWAEWLASLPHISKARGEQA